ncbi:MAG: site-2 protease family protein [Verrucomicrobia bacterium]|nr:site-2 protease family protein [Verrucomicrobiota bacterium]
MDAQTLRDGLLQLILLIISIGLHEFGHAWMADLRGDPLPRMQGRVTLNPFAHTDPIGTIAIPAVMIFLSPGFGLIGWGKPVQISLPNPKTRRMDDIYITLAGPAMNLVLCLVFAVIGGLGNFDPKTQEVVIRFLVGGIYLNAGLVVFNLIPIPPLDGSRLALRLGLYSEELFLTLARWGFIILIILVNLSPFLRKMRDGVSLLASPWFALWDFLS